VFTPNKSNVGNRAIVVCLSNGRGVCHRSFSWYICFSVMTSKSNFESVNINKGTSLPRIRCRSCLRINALSNASGKARVSAAILDLVTRREL
jgi:hypothetical protein